MPVEYLATRALRKLPVVRSIADMKAQRNDGNTEASKAKNVQVSESQEGKVNQANTVFFLRVLQQLRQQRPEQEAWLQTQTWHE